MHQRYFARAGLRERVIDTRVEASRRLLELGVPAGQIWVPLGGEPGVPDVIWNCVYPSMDERERFRMQQESDPTFHAIRTRQGTQLERWVREHYRLLDGQVAGNAPRT
ncbi:MAG: hypothetical protein ACT4PY_08650 [Armatimonadota bacterium]